MERDDYSTSAATAARQLHELLLAGRFSPGERLHQDRLADELGLSRTPLRTALASLVHTGLVTYEPNRGYRVRAFSLDDLCDAFALRAELESMACRLAAPRIDAAALDRLDDLVAQGCQLLGGGVLDPARLEPYRQMNVDFHDTILSASGSGWLPIFVRQLHNVPMASDRVILWNDWTVIARSHEDHARIARALRDRDGRRAAGLMLEHVTFSGQLLIRHLEPAPPGDMPRRP